jgi:hypothetical protein
MAAWPYHAPYSVSICRASRSRPAYDCHSHPNSAADGQATEQSAPEVRQAAMSQGQEKAGQDEQGELRFRNCHSMSPLISKNRNRKVPQPWKSLSRREDSCAEGVHPLHRSPPGEVLQVFLVDSLRAIQPTSSSRSWRSSNKFFGSSQFRTVGRAHLALFNQV